MANAAPSPRRAVVLGGHGFIGRAIARRLQQQYEVEALSSRDFDLTVGRAAGEALAPRCKDALVVYAAGIPRLRGDGWDQFYGNLHMVEALCEVCALAQPTRLIFLSTVEVYGIPKTTPITEAIPPAPDTLYGVGKATAELLVQRCAAHTGVPADIIRLPGIYGPGDGGRGFVGALAKASLSKSPFTLTADPTELRDYVFVDDVAAVVAALAEGPGPGGLYNIASGTSQPISDIIDAVFAALGETPIIQKPRQNPRADIVFDPKALRARLPDVTFTVLSEGAAAYRK